MRTSAWIALFGCVLLAAFAAGFILLGDEGPPQVYAKTLPPVRDAGGAEPHAALHPPERSRRPEIATGPEVNLAPVEANQPVDLQVPEASSRMPARRIHLAIAGDAPRGAVLVHFFNSSGDRIGADRLVPDANGAFAFEAPGAASSIRFIAPGQGATDTLSLNAISNSTIALERELLPEFQIR